MFVERLSVINASFWYTRVHVIRMRSIFLRIIFIIGSVLHAKL